MIQQTKTPDFADHARDLALGWTQRLKWHRSPRGSDIEEPDAATAWEYCQGKTPLEISDREEQRLTLYAAYFNESYDSTFGVVPRQEFEAQLRLQYETGATDDDDFAWYALRNTVYASGCRIVLSKRQSTSFAEAQAHAWKYFEKALSVHWELLYSRTGLAAVQALAAMVGICDIPTTL